MEEQEIEDLVLDDMGIGDLEEVVGIERASCTQPWSETLFFNEIKIRGPCRGWRERRARWQGISVPD